MSATVNTRIQLKRDTTQHWNEALGFIPLEGEFITIIKQSRKKLMEKLDKYKCLG